MVPQVYRTDANISTTSMSVQTHHECLEQRYHRRDCRTRRRHKYTAGRRNFMHKYNEMQCCKLEVPSVRPEITSSFAICYVTIRAST